MKFSNFASVNGHRCAKRFVMTIFAVFACFAFQPAHAAVVFSNSSVVSTTDRSATFDSLTSNGIDLTAYVEDFLSISVNNVTFQGFPAFSPGDPRTTAFHYGNGGGTNFVTITGTDGAVFTAIDFLLGNGNGGSTTNLVWQTLLLGSSTGSGVETGLGRGSTAGWTDISGFDELRVAAGASTTAFGQTQAIALDDVRTQLNLAPVPIPAALPLFGTALAVMSFIGWRRKRVIAA